MVCPVPRLDGGSNGLGQVGEDLSGPIKVSLILEVVMTTQALRIARRFVLDKTPPERFWMAWTNVKDYTLSSLLEYVSQLASFNNRKITRVLLQLQKLSSNVLWMSRTYDSKFRRFRGQSTWTPTLLELLRELSKDRKLLDVLNVEVSNHYEDSLFDGLLEVEEAFHNPVKFKVIDQGIQAFWDYAEKPSEQALREAREALKKVQSLDTRPEEQALKAFVTTFPELKDHLDGEGSLPFFRKWLASVAVAIQAGDPKTLRETLNDWEDALPTLLKDSELTADITSLKGKFEGPQSVLYWYEEELNQLGQLLGVLS